MIPRIRPGRDGIVRFVVAECIGGPCDGERTVVTPDTRVVALPLPARSENVAAGDHAALRACMPATLAEYRNTAHPPWVISVSAEALLYRELRQRCPVDLDALAIECSAPTTPFHWHGES